jgi:ribosome-associated toxin RatA of RatAB toxin-antitoxin module
VRWTLIVLLLTGVAHADDWRRVADRDGIVVESRSVDGSPIQEVRVTAHSPLPPAAIMSTLWKPKEYVEFIPYLKSVEVLRDDGDTRLVYEQIRVPVLKDRDVTVRVTRAFSPETGWEMRSVAAPAEGPPESKDYVRVRMMEARWRLVPDGTGTAVAYNIRTDVGPWIPAWIVNRGQRDITAKLVRAMLDRAQESYEKGR